MLFANNIFQQRVIAWNAVGKRWLCFCSQLKSADPCNWNVWTKEWLSPLSVRELFEQSNEKHYDLRKNSQFTVPPLRTVYHGSESITFLGPKIWIIVPNNLKNVNSTEVFKIQIKKWKPKNCPCRLCKVYVQNVSFV